MSAKINDLNPQPVWSWFYEITQIPRPSKKEAEIIEARSGVYKLPSMKQAML